MDQVKFVKDVKCVLSSLQPGIAFLSPPPLFYLNMMLNLGMFTNIKVVKFDLSESDIFIT